MDREDVTRTQGVAWEEADIAPILRKRGKEWEYPAEVEKVYSYIEHQVLDDLVRFAYGFTRAAPDGFELARDVTMDKILDALVRYRHTYDPGRYRGRGNPFKNWLYTMLARAARRRMDRQRRREEAERRHAEQREREQHDAPLPNRPPKWAEHWDEIEPYLRQLPLIYREALDLHYRQRLPIADAADRAGCSEGAFKVRLYRARQELRRLRGNDDPSSGGDNLICL